MVDLQIVIALPYNFSLKQRFNYHLYMLLQAKHIYASAIYQTEDPPPSLIKFHFVPIFIYTEKMGFQSKLRLQQC